MQRLSLPSPSEQHYLFTLKSDHVSMMRIAGYTIDDDEKSFAIENTDDIFDKQKRFKQFMKLYADENKVVERFKISKYYTHPNEKYPDQDVVFTYKQYVRDVKNAAYGETMRSDKPNNRVIVQITKEKPPEDAKIKTDDKTPIRYFLDRQITFDAREHSFSTTIMRKLSPAEKEAFLAQSGIVGKTFSGILNTDPISIFNDWRIGPTPPESDIIQTRRENIFAGSPSVTISYLQVKRQPQVKQKTSQDVQIEQ